MEVGILNNLFNKHKYFHFTGRLELTFDESKLYSKIETQQY